MCCDGMTLAVCRQVCTAMASSSEEHAGTRRLLCLVLEQACWLLPWTSKVSAAGSRPFYQRLWCALYRRDAFYEALQHDAGIRPCQEVAMPGQSKDSAAFMLLRAQVLVRVS